MNDSSNLAGEIISEMQRTNPPNVFNAEGTGTSNGAPIGGVASGANANENVQINPALQQRFMQILRQNPKYQQMFADPQVLQQTLNNPNAMMNLVHQYEQENPVENVTQPPIENTSADNSDQYDENDDMPPALQTSEKGWFDRFMDELKCPFISMILYVILTQTIVREFILGLIPQIHGSLVMQTIVMALIFLVLSYSFKKVLDIVLK